MSVSTVVMSGTVIAGALHPGGPRRRAGRLMARTTINDLKARRLDQMSAAEGDDFDATYTATRLALEVGEQVRDAREAAGLTQQLASRMGTVRRPSRVSKPAASTPRSRHCRRLPRL
ncbi:MAG: hypothetical protein M5U19_07680 [Microthrixaceae bacterium]|nr:hypothetical protein [Microthrixaceae bacterium]